MRSRSVSEYAFWAPEENLLRSCRRCVRAKNPHTVHTFSRLQLALLAFGPRQRKKVKYVESEGLKDNESVKKKKAVKRKPQRAAPDESVDASLRRLARALKRYGDFVARLDECAEEAGLEGKSAEVCVCVVRRCE